jgi:hypothetical protein
MKKTSLIKENAKLQELLNPINEEYYGNLLIYVRSTFRDPPGYSRCSGKWGNC